ncbi:hypothetical protein GF323_02490 [Candidatus Woesearchaeota archaeon]|nr:hypothetical protein [Candidatus Woesearchaeota archaeon]
MQKTTYKDFKQSMKPLLGPMILPTIRFKGVWDMQDLYEFMINYLRERKYKFHERVYKHKHPSPFGVERQYVWRAEKEETDVYRFDIDIYIHTYDAHDIDVKMKDGAVRTFTKGRIWITFNCGVQMYEDTRWSLNRFWANLRIFLNNYVMRKKHGWDVWDVMIYREVEKLIWLTRRRLKMEYDEYEQKYWTGVHG